MNWQIFQTYNDSYNNAFEAFCIQLFEKYCYRKYKDLIECFNVVNGSGGDGGVEAYTMLTDNTIVGLQAKWFRNTLQDAQFAQIKKSIKTALYVRPNISKYIVCIPKRPRDLRIGSNKKVTKNVERIKWSELVSQLKREYPNLEILLWDENQLLNELQEHECSGIKRYWFQKSELDIGNLKYVFEKQKISWLSLKYIPDLHSNGDMCTEINKFLGDPGYKKELLNEIKNLILRHRKLIELTENIIKWCNVSEKLGSIIADIKNTSENNIAILEKYKNILIRNCDISHIEKLHYVDFKDILETFCETNSSSTTYYSKLKNIIDEFGGYWGGLENKIIKLNNDYLLTFIGNPGTGKTHGIANYTETLLENEFHVAILIQARSVSPSDSWKDILIKNLGLSQDWSEDEIFKALEALSYRLQVKNISKQSDDTPYMIPKVLICIDGLDELKPFDFWINKLRETKEIAKEYKRIRFCATTRPCVFEKLKYNDELRKTQVFLKPSGDVPTNELFDKYVFRYNIKINNCNWLKWTIKTPLALKLFCEINEGRVLSNINKKSVTLSKLIEEKIKIIDSEFRVLCNNYNEDDNIIFNSLKIIGEYFLSDRCITRNNLIELLKKNELLGIVNAPDLSSLIAILEENGFLQSYVEHTSEILSTKKVCYEKGIQPFFDYILAILLLNKYKDPKELKGSDVIFKHEETLQTYAMMLLEEKQMLFSDIPIVRKKLESYEIVTYDFFALANNDSEITAKYKPRILKFMKKNATHLIKAVNDLVLQLARLENHPLGPMLLHEFLSSFKKPITRDYYWGIQTWLRYSQGKIWESQEKFEPAGCYKLIPEDKFNGLPLIFAWLLTNLDNKKRMLYRIELTKWSIQCPEEFCKLFDLTISTNDPQMKEELYAIAMGLVYSIPDNTAIIQHFINHIFDKVFKDKKSSTNNIAIRQYCRAIAEMAYRHKLITKKQLNICIPPFKASDEEICLSKEALSGDRMRGYRPIGYDLSRYVLCEPILSLFFEKRNKNHKHKEAGRYDYYFATSEIDNILNANPNLNEDDRKELLRTKELRIKRELEFEKARTRFLGIVDNISDKEKAEFEAHIDEVTNKTLTTEEIYGQYEIKAQKLLQKANLSLNVEGILPDKFVLAAAHEYLKQNGYKDETKDFDNSVQCHCRPATHGSKSSVMSVCEKYIWCFQHEIYGYLSDRLKIRNDYSHTIKKIDDYSLIDTELINPVQEICEHNIREKMQNNEWFEPEALSPVLKGLSNTKKDIIKWINTAPPPNFSKWINIESYAPLKQFKKNWAAISSFMVQKEPNVGAETVFWLNCCIVKNSAFQYLISDLKNKQEHICALLNNPCDISGRTLSYCYITPKEICQMDWKHGGYETINNYTVADNKIVEYELIKGIEECTVGYADTGEEGYTLPSKYLRKLLGIVDGNGIQYFDKDKKVQAIAFASGIVWGEEQHFVAVNKDLLDEKLKENNMKIFWLCRVSREQSLECSQKYNDFYCQNDATWIVWEEDKHFKQFCFSQSKDCSKQ